MLWLSSDKEGGSGLVVRSERDSLAKVSACSLPGIPTWLGTQSRITKLGGIWVSVENIQYLR